MLKTHTHILYTGERDTTCSASGSSAKHTNTIATAPSSAFVNTMPTIRPATAPTMPPMSASVPISRILCATNRSTRKDSRIPPIIFATVSATTPQLSALEIRLSLIMAVHPLN